MSTTEPPELAPPVRANRQVSALGRVLKPLRLGHKRKDVDDLYSHITEQMIEETLDALQQRWEQDGGWTWQETPAVEPKTA